MPEPTVNVLEWDTTGQKFFETGLDKVALFVYDAEGKKYAPPVAWSGVTAVNESPSGAEENPLYADNTKYLSIRGVEQFGATIEAYMWPNEFEECDGTASVKPGMTIGQQKRKMFGLAYRTCVGNDVEYENHAYKIHIIYGATASPSERSYATINENPEAGTFSWQLSTTPVNVSGFKPTSTVVLDSRKVKPETMKKIEDALYGTTEKAGSLLLPDEIKALFGEV